MEKVKTWNELMIRYKNSNLLMLHVTLSIEHELEHQQPKGGDNFLYRQPYKFQTHHSYTRINITVSVSPVFIKRTILKVPLKIFTSISDMLVSIVIVIGNSDCMMFHFCDKGHYCQDPAQCFTYDTGIYQHGISVTVISSQLEIYGLSILFGNYC